jgi:transposase
MQLSISLTVEQEQELEGLVARHAKPYIREKAAAILKVAHGQSGVAVAGSGLLRKRRKNTVYDWVHRYQAEGVQGLFVRKGRGLKPAFSPCPRK